MVFFNKEGNLTELNDQQDFLGFERADYEDDTKDDETLTKESSNEEQSDEEAYSEEEDEEEEEEVLSNRTDNNRRPPRPPGGGSGNGRGNSNHNNKRGNNGDDRGTSSDKGCQNCQGPHPGTSNNHNNYYYGLNPFGNAAQVIPTAADSRQESQLLDSMKEIKRKIDFLEDQIEEGRKNKGHITDKDHDAIVELFNLHKRLSEEVHQLE
jgi:hypothetical protein